MSSFLYATGICFISNWRSFSSHIAHAMLFEEFSAAGISLHYSLPPVNLGHIQNLTTDFGMIQFSTINHPDPGSGYTIDDNARAMIAMCMHYEITGDLSDLDAISRYLHFIGYCILPDGRFLNYVNSDQQFMLQNGEANLDDANGRAIWALGYLASLRGILPLNMISTATDLIGRALTHIEAIHSTRAIAFALKGLYYYHEVYPSPANVVLAEKLATKLERMYVHECDTGWNWFESYLTYCNSILPEGMLCTFLITGNSTYKKIAKVSFDFLLSNTFKDTRIKLISNRSWLQKGKTGAGFGEQPIDVAYTILALGRFYDVFKYDAYLEKMEIAFSWFLGNNHLHQIIYNPCTGGCYDRLEEKHVNLNQGAELTISYLMARLTIGKYIKGPYHSHELCRQQAML